MLMMPEVLASLNVVESLEDVRLCVREDGRNGPVSRLGRSSRQSVGTSKMRQSFPGAFAKTVTDASSGPTSKNTSPRKGRCLLGGSRVLSAE